MDQKLRRGLRSTPLHGKGPDDHNSAMIVMTSHDIIQLHKLVWLDKSEELKELLEKIKVDVDPDSLNTISMLPINQRFRGNTPLCLAIMLGHKDCVRILIDSGASCLVATSAGFYPLSEAISYGDRDLLRSVIVARLKELRGMVQHRNPRLRNSLESDLKDFYVELKWQFHSWVPFIANVLPHDTCRLWKRGNMVRIDSTLKGFEGYTWHRGDISFIIKVEKEGTYLYVVDHERKIFDEVNQLRDYNNDAIEMTINSYLNNDIVNAKLHKSAKDGSRIKFEPKVKKAGWFSTSKTSEQLEEIVSGYPSRVYEIKNVRWITKKRHEHIRDRCSGSDAVKEKQPNIEEKITDLEEMEDSDGTEQHEETVKGIIADYKDSLVKHAATVPAPPKPVVSFDEYFSEDKCDEYVHVGRAMDLNVKEKSMRANVWMADNYPLTVEELVPLLGLVAPTNKQFQKLVEFIESDLPDGFPVKIDIPIFSFLSGVCTFANFTEWTRDITQLPTSRPSEEPDSWFAIPKDYQRGVVIKNIFEKD